MTSVTTVCPYCNAALPPITAPATATRMPCPRCGEPLPSERFPIGEAHGAIVAGHPQGANPRRSGAPHSDAGKRKTLQVVLSIMAGMAAFALVFALYTKSIRRDRDPKPNRPVDVELARDPAQLLGLGYLPRGANLVAGLHIAALLKSESGKSLLRQPRPELVATMLGTLDAVGLSVADVDHVVLGTELPNIPPQVTTVIVTVKPYDTSWVREAIERQPFSESSFRGRPLYKWTKSKQVPKVWLADPRVVVVTTLTTEELERIPAMEKSVLESLTPPVSKTLALRIGKQSRVWAVGDLEPAKGLADLALQVGLLPKDQSRLLTLIRAFALGVAADEQEGLTLTGHFQTADAKASAALGEYLEGLKIDGVRSKRVELPPADVKDAEAQWVTWQVRGNGEAMRSALDLVRLGPWKRKSATK